MRDESSEGFRQFSALPPTQRQAFHFPTVVSEHLIVIS
jgi:hypothetical protein